jgi:hypothetical protein
LARAPVSIPDTHAIDWQPLPTTDGNVAGPVFKVLTTDPESQAATILMHLPPGWHDDDLDWHPCAEEAFRLAGWVNINGRHLPIGNYLYRPAGILHGPVWVDPVNGATGIQRFPKQIRILRYTGDEFPYEDLQPISGEHERDPFTWHEKLDTTRLPWEDCPAGGPWAGARYRWLNRNRETGGGALHLQLPAGWSGAGAPCLGQVEEFVVEGAVEMDGERFVQWGYRCRGKGDAAGRYSTAEGAFLICWWELDELAG